MTTEATTQRCHDCGTHDKCVAQQQAEEQLAEARMENARLQQLVRALNGDDDG